MGDFTTWNPADKHATIALSNDNLAAAKVFPNGYTLKEEK